LEPFDSVQGKLKSLSLLLFTSAIYCNALKSAIFQTKGEVTNSQLLAKTSRGLQTS